MKKAAFVFLIPILVLSLWGCKKQDANELNANANLETAKVKITGEFKEVITDRVLSAIAENVKEQFGTSEFTVNVKGAPLQENNLEIYTIEYRTSKNYGTAMLVNEINEL